MDTFYPDRNHICQPLLKIKFTSFGTYNDIGHLPQDYTQLIKNISQLVFPNNFSLTFLSPDLSTISINNSDSFYKLGKYVKDNNLLEVKLFVIVYERLIIQTRFSELEVFSSNTHSNLLGCKNIEKIEKNNYEESNYIASLQSNIEKSSSVTKERKFSNKSTRQKYSKRNSRNENLSEKNCIKCC